MTLAAGTKLGPYEILAPLGAGGVLRPHRLLESRPLGLDHANVQSVSAYSYTRVVSSDLYVVDGLK